MSNDFKSSHFSVSWTNGKGGKRRKYFYEKHPQERSKMKSLNPCTCQSHPGGPLDLILYPLLFPDMWVFFRSSKTQCFTSPAHLQFPSCILFASALSTSNQHPFTHCIPFLGTFSAISQQNSLGTLAFHDMMHG